MLDLALATLLSATACPVGETRLHIEDEGGRLVFETSDLTEFRNLDAELVGFTGPAGQDLEYIFRRDGDYSDGGLDAEGAYDVGTYPYNLVFQIYPERANDRVDHKGFYALAGTFTVHSTFPAYFATFEVEGLHDGRGEDPGEPMKGKRVGCVRFETPKR